MLVGGFFGFFLLRQAEGGRLKLPVGKGTPDIILGDSHGLILASDGSLWAWGDEELGWPVLGLGKIRTQVQLRRIGNETNWVSVATGGSHNIALKSDGTLWAWGQNLYSQLGDGTKITQNIPTRSVPGNDWKQVAAGGGGYSVALKKDGTLWAWGNNWTGQLGIGSTSNSAIAVQVGSGTNWIKVWAEGIQTVGMQSDGSLWVWGGDSSSSKVTTPILSPTRLSPDTNWVDVSFGYFMALAVKSDGTLWAWGRNAHFYTGASNDLANASPARVGTNSDWQACSSFGDFYHLLMKRDGSLWALDASDHRIVKPDSSYRPIELKRIRLQKDFVAFAAAKDCLGVALTRDGEVWTWGILLGKHSMKDRFMRFLAEQCWRFGWKVQWGLDPNPIKTNRPQLLRNVATYDPVN